MNQNIFTRQFGRTAIFATAMMGLLVTSSASAQWSGDAQLGAISTGGNTDNYSLTGRLDVSRESGSWIHNVIGSAYQAEVDSETTADQLSIGYKPKRLLNDATYLFGLLNYDEDEFSDIDERTREVIGVGHYFIKGEDHELLGEAGIGGRQTSFISGLEDSDEAILYLFGRYKQPISENVKFIQTLGVDIGSDNTFLESLTGIQVGLGGNLALQLSYALRRNSDIEGARGDNDDSVTGATLVYGF